MRRTATPCAPSSNGTTSTGDTMKSSEFKLVDAFLEAASAGRGGSANKLAAMLRGASPTPPSAPAPTPKATTHKPAPHKTPPAPRPKTVDFGSVVHRNPGGESVGVVELRRGGVKTPLIEIYPRRRPERRQARPGDRRALRPPLDHGPPLVDEAQGRQLRRFDHRPRAPRAEKGIVVTADPAFAKACGTDRRPASRRC